MTTGILAKLGLTSWDQASAWATGRIYPCEQCENYDRDGQCRFYLLCKAQGPHRGDIWFTRNRKFRKPYQDWDQIL